MRTHTRTSCEIVGQMTEVSIRLRYNDLGIFKGFDLNFTELEKVLDVNCISMLLDYQSSD